jgi:hypothetical protein
MGWLSKGDDSFEEMVDHPSTLEYGELGTLKVFSEHLVIRRGHDRPA